VWVFVCVRVCIITGVCATAVASFLCVHPQTCTLIYTHAHTYTLTVVILRIRLRHETRLLFHVRVSECSNKKKQTTDETYNCLLLVMRLVLVTLPAQLVSRPCQSPVNATRCGKCPTRTALNRLPLPTMPTNRVEIANWQPQKPKYDICLIKLSKKMANKLIVSTFTSRILIRSSGNCWAVDPYKLCCVCFFAKWN